MLQGWRYIERGQYDTLYFLTLLVNFLFPCCIVVGRSNILLQCLAISNYLYWDSIELYNFDIETQNCLCDVAVQSNNCNGQQGEISIKEKFVDTKWVIKSCKSKDRHYNDQQNRDKGHTIICKILHRKLKIGQHEPH